MENSRSLVVRARAVDPKTVLEVVKLLVNVLVLLHR